MSEISSTGDQMLRVLEAIVQLGPRSAGEVAADLGLNRTVAHRLLATLHGRGYVSRQGRRYSVGPMVGHLAAAGGMHDILQITRPIMTDLARRTGETVVLHRLDSMDAVVIDQAVGTQQLVRVQHAEGSRHPLHLGASGRAILAFQPKRFVEKAIATSGDRARTLELLETVRRNGYSASENELQQGVHGLAVPLREPAGTVSCSLAVLSPIQRADRLYDHLPALLAARDAICSQFERQAGHDPVAGIPT